MEEITLQIEGMSCQMCVKHVTQALLGLPGVEEASVDLASGTARVRYDAQQVDHAQFSAAVAETGYSVTT